MQLRQIISIIKLNLFAVSDILDKVLFFFFFFFLFLKIDLKSDTVH